MVRAGNRPRPEKLAGGPDPVDKGPRKVRAEGKLELPKVRLVVTPTLRRRLKRSVGRLYRPGELRSREFLVELRSSPLVVTVGDRVTETMHELGRTPEVQIVDQVEGRQRRQAPEVPYVRLFRASNPAGVITFDAVCAIGDAFEGEKPARVLIDGEEDLLAIPAIDSAPLGSVLYYGQPGHGVVMVKVDARSKESAERRMSEMVRETYYPSDLPKRPSGRGGHLIRMNPLKSRSLS